MAECFLPARNGVTNSVLRVVEQLDRHGIETLIVAPGDGPAECGGTRVVRVPGLSLPFYKDLSLGLPSPKLREALEEFAPTRCTSRHPRCSVRWPHGRRSASGSRSCPCTRPTTRASQSATACAPITPAIWRTLRRTHEHAAVTLAPSTSAAWQLQHHGIGPVALWGRGVDLERFNPKHRSPLLRRRLATNGEVVVGYVGRLAREKRVELLRHAALPGTQLVIVGDGPDRKRLERHLPMAQFVGFQSGAELSATFASLDVFVHTGAVETFCQSVQEALAAGVPVVAPAEGGPLDLVRHRENGYLYPPDDMGQLQGAVRRLVGDAALARAPGRGGPPLGRGPQLGRPRRPARRALRAGDRPAPRATARRMSTTGDATTGWLVVSIHDVAPPTTVREALRWTDDLDRRGVPSTLLVVPGPWRTPSFEPASELAAWLRQRQRQGDEIAQHGWEHRAAPGGPAWRRATGWVAARGCAELWSVERVAARRSLAAGRELLLLAGLATVGITASGLPGLPRRGRGDARRRVPLHDLPSPRARPAPRSAAVGAGAGPPSRWLRRAGRSGPRRPRFPRPGQARCPGSPRPPSR